MTGLTKHNPQTWILKNALHYYENSIKLNNHSGGEKLAYVWGSSEQIRWILPIHLSGSE